MAAYETPKSRRAGWRPFSGISPLFKSTEASPLRTPMMCQPATARDPNSRAGGGEIGPVLVNPVTDRVAEMNRAERATHGRAHSRGAVGKERLRRGQ